MDQIFGTRFIPVISVILIFIRFINIFWVKVINSLELLVFLEIIQLDLDKHNTKFCSYRFKWENIMDVHETHIYVFSLLYRLLHSIFVSGPKDAFISLDHRTSQLIHDFRRCGERRLCAQKPICLQHDTSAPPYLITNSWFRLIYYHSCAGYLVGWNKMPHRNRTRV